MFDINEIAQRIAILTPPVLMAVTVHELAHGWVAWKLGDPTAKDAGRLTLNPIKHLDFVGTLVFFITRTIGWAKPVPVNPAYFRDPRRDMIWVSLAGPASNIILAIISAILLRATLGPLSMWESSASYILKPLLFMAYASIQINLGLAVFNLIPIPPLDGSKVLMGLLPRNLAIQYGALEQYGFILILLLVFTGATGAIIIPVIDFLNRILIGHII